MTLQVIVGSGPVGSATAMRLTEQGDRVRVLTRSGTEQEILHRTAKPQAWGGACRSVGVAP